ncbi:hypothetical protein BGZ47_009644 [Haplosporangium gracile]|nr:hypothetical protein BGZ47_009644 [Haplosporangium gracile]
MQSLMVYPNDSDFLHMASILDDNVTKQLINTDHHNNHNHHHMENFMTTSSTSASSSPIQDYLLAPPTYQHHPQHNQRQHQIQFPVVSGMPTMVTAAVSHSAPSSPSYPIIKSEEVQAQQRMDYLMFPTNFDLPSSATTISSTSSTSSQVQQQRMMPYDASLIQQRQHHQQQQQQHAQQLRLQHQRALEQQHQQMMFDATAPNHSTASTMSIPTTNTMMSTMSTNSAVPTTTPFFHPSNIGYMPAAHPAAPKRKREESGQSLPRQTSPQLIDNITTVMTTPSSSSSNMDEPSRSTSPSLVTLPKKTSSSPSSRPSTSSRLDKVKTTRSTKVTKFASSPTPSSSSIACTSAATFLPNTDMLISTSPAQDSKATRASTKKSTSPATKKAQSESRETSPISADSSAPQSLSPATGSGNITHPRRAAQNRAAQRTFRNRRKAYIKELEQKVQEMDQTRDLMDAIQRENQEVWRRLQVLEAMASQNGLQVPVFPALTPFSAHLNANVINNDGMMMMTSHSSNPMMGSSNEEDEDEDEDMSDSYAHPAYPLLHQQRQQHPQHQQL